MASLLSTTQITYLTGEFDKLWDTMSQFRTLIVHKAPIKTITPVTNNNYFPGYGNETIEENVTFTAVSGIFPCIAIYDKPPKPNETFQETKVSIGRGKTRIKVKADCHSYIQSGITESITVDGNTFNVVSDDGVQNYLGLMYYYYLLERTT